MALIKSEEREKAKTAFQEYLAKKKLRVTLQRMAIFDAAMNCEEHFTAEDLLGYACAIDRSVSRANVYRTLPILTESSLVEEIDIGHDYKFYLPYIGERIDRTQVICQDCNKIFEINAQFLEWYGVSIADKLELIPESQRLQIRAYCPKYRKENYCVNYKY